ncbi:Acetate kinase [Candidatus Methylomirabilis lanthanidiphila]|uniref:Acetate kinase n=1 Tax=Candidatus Methylomirabilis lanthanidiphila TaxID=2211376 RepID=A0A564ZGY9_9BACT|nr:acetate/propionate family kinase [Candidatus Methylomirabilis lanthanidiphila]VUZ84589.1 Acetate kinase [Candidatus Methylomirabilis lanthanidiphila]
MADAILVINAGSSSIKFSVYVAGHGDVALHVQGQVEGLFTAPRFTAKNGAGAVVSERFWGNGITLGHDGALNYLAAFLRQGASELRLVGVGHRVVHGGPGHTRPVRLDRQVLAGLETLIPLAPLHQPHNLTPIRILMERRSDVAQVACFDTSFHRTNPPVAQLYALPQALTDAGVRRYGFHGLSYEYIASVLPQFDARAAAGKTIVLHLGSGASMCALEAGRSVASTMGFTAVEGLPMGTRSGSLDPGLMLYLMDVHKMDARAIEHLIYRESGLLGVSGISSDMRALLASEDARAKLAIDLFVYRIGRELGSLAAALGGLDAVVFTAGIGERAAPIRERVCRDAAWLGVDLDPEANAAGGPLISTPNARVAVWVIPTNEELMIARHTRRLLNDL